MKCANDAINDYVKFRGNFRFQHKDRHYDRKLSEAIKNVDSLKKIEEYFQDKNGEKWWLIDVESREGFMNCTKSQIKCTAGIKICGERIKVIDKGNRHAFFPECKAIETWEHVVFFDKMKDKQDD